MKYWYWLFDTYGLAYARCLWGWGCNLLCTLYGLLSCHITAASSPKFITRIPLDTGISCQTLNIPGNVITK